MPIFNLAINEIFKNIYKFLRYYIRFSFFSFTTLKKMSAGENANANENENGNENENNIRVENVENERRNCQSSFEFSWLSSVLRAEKTIYKFRPFVVEKCCDYGNAQSEKYPIARSGHRMASNESYLYLLGGYNPAHTFIRPWEQQPDLFKELWSYNFYTQQWKREINATPKMPKELASNAMIIKDNYLLSFGGTGFPFGMNCSHHTYLFKLGTRPIVKRLKTAGQLPQRGYGSCIVMHGDYLYVLGGTTGSEYFLDIHRLRFKDLNWEIVYQNRSDMRDDPKERYRHEAVYTGSHIIILGGGTAVMVFDLVVLPAFNLTNNKWEYLNTLADPKYGYPSARKCFSCVQHTNCYGDVEACIVGGLSEGFRNPTTHYADVWKINMRTLQWVNMTTAAMPYPIYFHAAAHAGNGCMHIFGGVEEIGENQRTNNLYKIWITIPKLSEICWDAIAYYNRNLHLENRLEVRKQGIPAAFLERLPPERSLNDRKFYLRSSSVKRQRQN